LRNIRGCPFHQVLPANKHGEKESYFVTSQWLQSANIIWKFVTNLLRIAKEVDPACLLSTVHNGTGEMTTEAGYQQNYNLLILIIRISFFR